MAFLQSGILAFTYRSGTMRCVSALCTLALRRADVLAAQPRRRAGIQLWQGLRHLPSLQELRLENQTGVGMPENALACSGLTRLSLISCQLNTWPLSLQSHGDIWRCCCCCRALGQH